MQNKQRDTPGDLLTKSSYFHSQHSWNSHPKMSPEIHLRVSSWQATSEHSGFSRLAGWGLIWKKAGEIDGFEGATSIFVVGKHRKELLLLFFVFHTFRKKAPHQILHYGWWTELPLFDMPKTSKQMFGINLPCWGESYCSSKNCTTTARQVSWSTKITARRGWSGGRLATLKKDRLATLKKDRLRTLKHMTFRW